MTPIIPILAKVAIGAVADKIGSVALNQPKLEKAVESRIANDPALLNQLNGESLWRSRTANGSAVAFIGALVIVVQKVQTREFDDVFGMALATVIASGYAFAGRALNWSAPMWSRIGRWFA